MPLKALLLLALGLALILGAYLLTMPPSVPEPSAEDTQPKEPEEVRRKQFFDEQVMPALADASYRNEEAIERAKRSLDETFNRYRQGIPAYTENITSFLTQLNITRAAIVDRIKDGDEKTKIASTVFAETVFSEESLEMDLVAIVQQFESDLQANQNILLASVATRLKKADFPVSPIFVDGRAKVAELHNEVADFTLTSASLAGPVSAMAFAGGFASTLAAEMLVRVLLKRVAAQIAVRVGTATGGAIVGSAAAGGAVGTGAAPGPGTVVGVAAGVVVGFVVEHWMGERFREKLAIQCNALLDEIEAQIWSDPQKGLRVAFATAAEQANTVNEQTMVGLLALKRQSP